MRMRLAIRALIKYLAGLILVGILLFVPAGNFRYFEAWLFIGLLFVPMLLLGIVLLILSPELLQKRLESKEEEKTQKGVLGVFALLFIAGFVVAGLDYRFDWSHFPPIIPKIGSVFLLVCYALYAEVIRENAYLSRTIHVQEGQRVIDTGLYALVRHPMYTVTLLLFLSFAVVLNSLWTLFCFLLFIPLFVIRILNEEKVLLKDLQGYASYREKVKYRLIPFIW